MKDEISTARLDGYQLPGAAKIEAAPTVAIVEDDPAFREALTFQLSTANFKVVAYPSAESFLESTDRNNYDCVLADICLPKMNGLQLWTEIRQSVPYPSVIFVTGRSDMSIGIQAMREGAVDCLEKPIDDQTLLNTIDRAISHSRERRQANQRRSDLLQRHEMLTPREREVFALVTGGLLNKQVGASLGATERTIKTHRGRVMNKMNADSLADLVRMAEILQVQPIRQAFLTWEIETGFRFSLGGGATRSLLAEQPEG